MTQMGRIPPQDRLAEGQVLGSMILGGEVVADVREILGPDMFFVPAHQVICRALFSMADKGKPIDLASVFQEFGRLGILSEIGQGADGAAGREYLAALADGVPDRCNARYYAGIVAGAWRRRALIRAGETLVREAYERDAVADDVLDSHEARLFALAVKGLAGGECGTGADAARAAYDHAEAVRRHEVAPGLMTGFAGIDRPLGGIQRGDLVILAGSTGVGKSALALNIAHNAATDGGRVLYISAEMGAREKGGRLLAALSGVDRSQIKSGEYDERQRDALVTARDLPALERIHIMARAATVGEVASKARQLAMKYREPLAMVVVDYLQLMRPDNKRETKAAQIGGIAQGLKAAAMQLGTPVIALSQFSRDHQRASRAPGLHDLKESGDIENAANVVLILWRHASAPMDTDGAQLVYARIAKARDGRTTPWPRPGELVPGAIALRFWPHLTRFESAATRREGEGGGGGAKSLELAAL